MGHNSPTWPSRRSCWYTIMARSTKVISDAGHRAAGFVPPVSVPLQAFAHEVNMISQHVWHACIRDRHSETVCFFLQVIKPRNYFTRIAPDGTGVGHFIF